jgi:hypothetical protein
MMGAQSGGPVMLQAGVTMFEAGRLTHEHIAAPAQEGPMGSYCESSATDAAQQGAKAATAAAAAVAVAGGAAGASSSSIAGGGASTLTDQQQTDLLGSFAQVRARYDSMRAAMCEATAFNTDGAARDPFQNGGGGSSGASTPNRRGGASTLLLPPSTFQPDVIHLEMLRPVAEAAASVVGSASTPAPQDPLLFFDAICALGIILHALLRPPTKSPTALPDAKDDGENTSSSSSPSPALIENLELEVDLLRTDGASTTVTTAALEVLHRRYAALVSFAPLQRVPLLHHDLGSLGGLPLFGASLDLAGGGDPWLQFLLALLGAAIPPTAYWRAGSRLRRLPRCLLSGSSEKGEKTDSWLCGSAFTTVARPVPALSAMDGSRSKLRDQSGRDSAVRLGADDSVLDMRLIGAADGGAATNGVMRVRACTALPALLEMLRGGCVAVARRPVGFEGKFRPVPPLLPSTTAAASATAPGTAANSTAASLPQSPTATSAAAGPLTASAAPAKDSPTPKPRATREIWMPLWAYSDADFTSTLAAQGHSDETLHGAVIRCVRLLQRALVGWSNTQALASSGAAAVPSPVDCPWIGLVRVAWVPLPPARGSCESRGEDNFVASGGSPCDSDGWGLGDSSASSSDSDSDPTCASNAAEHTDNFTLSGPEAAAAAAPTMDDSATAVPPPTVSATEAAAGNDGGWAVWIQELTLGLPLQTVLCEAHVRGSCRLRELLLSKDQRDAYATQSSLLAAKVRHLRRVCCASNVFNATLTRSVAQWQQSGCALSRGGAAVHHHQHQVQADQPAHAAGSVSSGQATPASIPDVHPTPFGVTSAGGGRNMPNPSATTAGLGDCGAPMDANPSSIGGAAAEEGDFVAQLFGRNAVAEVASPAPRARDIVWDGRRLRFL